MLTSVRSLMAATLLAGSAFAATPAFAQDAEGLADSGLSVSGNAAIVTDYRFRGVSMSDGDFAVQGSIDVGSDSGLYVGTWASSITGGPDYGDMELDLYGGWSGFVASGVTLNVGMLYYLYPSGDTGADTDYLESYASIGSTLGPLGATLGAAYAWEQDALGGGDNLYLYTDFELGVPTTPLTLTAHLGYADGVLAPPFLAGAADDSGLDWSVGASATVLGGLSVGASYVGVEGPSIDGFTDDALVGSLSMSF